jgi:hypothetical protein
LLESEYIRLQTSSKALLSDCLETMQKFKKDHNKKSQKEIDEKISRVQSALGEIKYSVDQQHSDEA